MNAIPSLLYVVQIIMADERLQILKLYCLPDANVWVWTFMLSVIDP
jgi:hypothetical protein